MKLREIKIHNFRMLQDVTIGVSDYGLLIGANNAGKSSVLDAIRVAYGDLKFERARDRPKPTGDEVDPECWIDLEFELTAEEAATLKAEYLKDGNRLRVRRVLDSADNKRLHLYAFENGVLSANQFYGDDNVGQGKLGSILHVPAINKVDDVTKFSGPSPLRELVNGLFKKLLKNSAAFADLQKALAKFGGDVVQEKTVDGLSLSSLEAAINSGLGEWNVGFKFRTNAIAETDVVKSLLDFSLIDGATQSSHAPAAYGHGLQRHLIFTLLMVASGFAEAKPAGEKKEFAPELTILLFEEPEVFLHPQQQVALDSSLRKLAKNDAFQVIATTHSSHFVSRSADDIPALCRMYKKDAQAMAGQISKTKLAEIFLSNQEINTLAEKYKKYAASAEDKIHEMEALKYFMWLSAERSALFFARRILIVEGPTEVSAINYLQQSGLLDLPRDYFVLDAMGKFNVHRFMNLLGELKIDHSVLHDNDVSNMTGEDAEFHREVNDLIQRSRNLYTRCIHVLDKDLEGLFEFNDKGRANGKPTRILLALHQGAIKQEAVSRFRDLTRNLLAA